MFSKLPFSSLFEFGADQFGLYSIQNYIEVLILSFITYKILSWLAQDHTKHILLYVYAYAAFMIASYATSCITLFWILFVGMPLVALTTIVLHQKQMQKNFILASSKDLTPNSIPAKNWLEILIRSCLLAAYQKKQIFCIIESTDHLASALHSPTHLHLSLKQDIIDLIISSTALENPSIIWISQSGIMYTVNATWKETITNHILSPHQKIHYAEIALLTSKTDAFAWSIDPMNKMAMLWHQNTFIQQLTIDQLMKSCQKILNQKIEFEPLTKERTEHATKNNSHHSAS